jgi:hypothetical protein
MRDRHIDPRNLPPRVSILEPLVIWVALDYVGVPVWITSVVVFLSLALLVAAIVIRWRGEAVDVLARKELR